MMDWLENLTYIPDRTFICGDFNAHYRDWDFGVDTGPCGLRLSNWIAHHELEVYNLTGGPTHLKNR
jgi:hypothetical protein